MSVDYYTPLFDPKTDTALRPLPVDNELKLARELLDEVAGRNIHSKDDMIHVAVVLEQRMRALVDALTAERGGAE